MEPVAGSWRKNPIRSQAHRNRRINSAFCFIKNRAIIVNMENERKPYGGFAEFMKQEGNAAMYEQNRQKIQAAEIELEEFIKKFERYGDQDNPQQKTYYEMGMKMRQEDIEFMKKFLTNFTKNG